MNMRVTPRSQVGERQAFGSLLCQIFPSIILNGNTPPMCTVVFVHICAHIVFVPRVCTLVVFTNICACKIHQATPKPGTNVYYTTIHVFFKITTTNMLTTNNLLQQFMFALLIHIRIQIFTIAQPIRQAIMTE